MSRRTSDGLIDLLLRNGVKPTGDSKNDIELARQFMPEKYKINNESKRKNKAADI